MHGHGTNLSAAIYGCEMASTEDDKKYFKPRYSNYMSLQYTAFVPFFFVFPLVFPDFLHLKKKKENLKE